MLLSLAERRLGIAERLARCFPDRRDPHAHRVTRCADMIRARIFAIACGYEDADDLDLLRIDPAFKLACGRLPDTGARPVLAADPVAAGERAAPEGRDPPDLCAGRSMDGHLRNAAGSRHARHRRHLRRRRTAISSLSLFNAHYDERCFLPIHVYDTDKSRPVAVLLRPGKTPSRRRGARPSAPPRAPHPPRWPTTRITIPGRWPLWPPRGDGLVRRATASTTSSACPARSRCRARSTRPPTPSAPSAPSAPRTCVRGFAETRHKAKSWDTERRAVARIEATTLGLDIRFVVTNLERGSAGMALRDPLLRARAGGEPDQAAQGPARLRPHVLPLGRSPTRSASFCTPPPTG